MNPLGSTPTTVRSTSDIGTLVRRRRMELRMTQQDLANMVGTSRRFIGELEDGKETAQIGKVLGVLSNLGIALTAVAS
jgi:HTH-type transcriptional regulator/antitoxin HipB